MSKGENTVSQPVTSSGQSTAELIEGAKANLLRYLRFISFSNETIEQMIISLAADHPLKFHLISQFLASLPEAEREATQNRLLPPLKEGTVNVREPVVLDDDDPYGPPID